MERQERKRALIIGAQLGCLLATLILAFVVFILGVPEAINGNILSAVTVAGLFLIYGLLIGGIFVNVFLWLVLLPVYGRSSRSLSLLKAVGYGLLVGPIYVLLLVFTLVPGRFSLDFAELLVNCGIGMLYGGCVAYWCVRLEQRFRSYTAAGLKAENQSIDG